MLIREPSPPQIGRYAAPFVAVWGGLLLIAPFGFLRPGDLTAGDPLLGTLVRSVAFATVSTAVACVIGLRVGTRLADGAAGPLVRFGVDLPLMLPPVVVGFCLLALFRGPLAWIDRLTPIVAEPLGIFVAQTTVAVALASRFVESAVSGVDPRLSAAAASLGHSPDRVWRAVRIAESWRGLLASVAVVWAQTFGSFGPVLVLAGVTRGRTEVLPTAVYLEMTSGEIGRAAAVVLVMAGIGGAATLAASLADVRRGERLRIQA